MARLGHLRLSLSWRSRWHTAHLGAIRGARVAKPLPGGIWGRTRENQRQKPLAAKFWVVPIPRGSAWPGKHQAHPGEPPH